eukprot:scaffold5784_cov18-Tisochrysis_lutea.AAC.1
MALLSSSLKLAGPHSLLRPRGIPTVSAVSPHTEAVVEVHCAKDRCVHPGRPASELCKDCPRRKQKKKSMSAMVGAHMLLSTTSIVEEGSPLWHRLCMALPTGQYAAFYFCIDSGTAQASAEDVARLEGLLAKPCALLDVGVEVSSYVPTSRCCMACPCCAMCAAALGCCHTSRRWVCLFWAAVTPWTEASGMVLVVALTNHSMFKRLKMHLSEVYMSTAPRVPPPGPECNLIRAGVRGQVSSWRS